MNNKAKGSAFERLVCRQLSLWVTSGEKDDLFWRSAMSGGRATLARKRGEAPQRVAGDIASVAPEGHALTDHWYVECKHLKTLELTAFVCTQRGALANEWRKCCDAAEHHSKRPMLIAKQNLQPALAIVPSGEVIIVRSSMVHALRLGAIVHDFATLLHVPFDFFDARKPPLVKKLQPRHSS